MTAPQSYPVMLDQLPTASQVGSLHLTVARYISTVGFSGQGEPVKRTQWFCSIVTEVTNREGVHKTVVKVPQKLGRLAFDVSMGEADLRLTAVLEIFEGRRREACNWGIEREAGFYAHDLQTLNKLLRLTLVRRERLSLPLGQRGNAGRRGWLRDLLTAFGWQDRHPESAILSQLPALVPFPEEPVAVRKDDNGEEVRVRFLAPVEQAQKAEVVSMM
ncbi:hypothetical protein FA13DRAFT_1707617 [Coprinellus micaceus]|uniref:Uncharacterized protein n=1 Tax=Coprinellus micaceus TaxID=71717 RepID=A0A4Y7TKS9_COPMI|nr:hypothetical protein FA13DRAFT_1707617 [Coprinellus micaceus]